MEQGIVYNIQRLSVHDGPGIRTTIFLKGCPLRCVWCSNPESQSFKPQVMFFKDLCTNCGQCVDSCPHGAAQRTKQGIRWDTLQCRDCALCIPGCPSSARAISGTYMTVNEVMSILHKDALFYANSGGGVTIGGGEPTAGGDFFLALASAVRQAGYHLTVDTCGFCPEDRFDQTLQLADLLLYDCKHMDPVAHKKLTGQDNDLILKNLDTALSSSLEIRIRMPLMPGLNDSEENIRAMAAFLLPRGKQTVEIMPYHRFGHNKYAALGKASPELCQYTPEELKQVEERFTRYGLQTTLV